MKVFLSKYGSLILSLFFLALFILRTISVGSSFDEDSAICGLFAGGFACHLGDFVSSKLPFGSKTSTDPEA